MKYKWLIGTWIILIILTGCEADNSFEDTTLVPDQIQESQLNEDNNFKPLDSETTNVASTVVTEENEQNNSKLPEDLLIEGWKVGVPFSEVVGNLPEDLEIDDSYMRYRFKSKDFDLYFTGGGVLDYIVTDESGKGLNVNLHVGDDEQKIENVLGRTVKKESVKDGYLGYTFSFDDYDIIIFTRDNTVQGIGMQLTGSPTIYEPEEISNYYSNYIDTMNNNTSQTNSNAPQKETVQYTTREELIALRDDFFNRYKNLLEVLSNDSSNSKKIDAIFSDIDFNQVELDLEKASTYWSSKDKMLAQLITEFVESVLDIYQWQMIENNSDDDQIRSAAAYQIRDSAVKAQKTNQKILIMINYKE
ncbi:hypothetical protein [Paenibacillus motobuensis]|uniref:Lipoprotein n=1 Tax=Paenibacillus motobuensis TaxID=295324 RepID=A0ABN0YPN5_9BACL